MKSNAPGSMYAKKGNEMTTLMVATLEQTLQLRVPHQAEAERDAHYYMTMIRDQVDAFGGRIVQSGDGETLAIFEQGEPLLCALTIQKQANLYKRAEQVPIRLALHSSDATVNASEWQSQVRRALRLVAVAWPGQILLTPELLHTLTLPQGATLEDLGIHMLRDLGTPQKVYRLVHPELPQQHFPPLRSLSEHPNNLPAQPTPFLGREEELAYVAHAIEDPSCRLLTITGPGGMGKTRLSIQAAAEAMELFPDGVYFVSLTPLSSPEFIVSAVAVAVGFDFYGQEAPKTQLLNFLREKNMLLVLDNFEHVMEGIGLVAEILKTTPVKVIVTSRERLGMQGELLYELRGLPVPLDDEATSFGEYSAIQLFMQSAQRIEPDFIVSNGERGAIIRICQLVEGVPLGIELAASWVQMLPADEIVKEIEGSLDFLETSQRDMPARHRSLRAVCDYSWQLLSEQERLVLRRLSVFRGPFHRLAAAQVASAIQEQLSSLVNKSLVVQVNDDYFEIHEILRHYAAGRLAVSTREQNQTMHSHCTYYASFLQMREASLQRNYPPELLAEIGREIENLRVAWNFALDQRLLTELSWALEGLYLFYDLRGWVQEGEEAFHRAMGRFTTGRELAPEQPLVVCKLIVRRGEFLYRLGRYAEAQTQLLDGLKRARALNLTEEIILCLNVLGDLARSQGEYPEARQMLEESLDLSRGSDNLRGMTRALNNLGIVAGSVGELPEAEQLFNEAISYCKKLGDRRGISKALSNLGILAFYREDLGQARELLQESRTIYEAIGDRIGIANSLNNLGNIARQLGDYNEAKTLHRQSLRLFKEVGYRLGIVLNLDDLGIDTSMLGEYHESKGHFRSALRAALDMGAPPLALNVMVGLATVMVREERTEEALRILGFTLHHPASSKETKDRTEQLLTELEPALPDEVRATRESEGDRLAMSLEEMASEVLI